MAKATVVSLFPLPIHERKLTLDISEYRIAAAPKGGCSVLVIEPTKFPIYTGEDRGNIKVTATEDEIAAAIVNDFCNAQFGADADAGPGLFWLEGNVPAGLVPTKYEAEFLNAQNRQNIWYKRIVEIADQDFAKTRQYSIVSPIQKLAALQLNLTREWLIDKEIELGLSLRPCPACTTLVQSVAIICPTCKCILNEEKAKKLAFAN